MNSSESCTDFNLLQKLDILRILTKKMLHTDSFSEKRCNRRLYYCYHFVLSLIQYSPSNDLYFIGWLARFRDWLFQHFLHAVVMSIPIYLISTQDSSKNKLTNACSRHIFWRIPRSFFILSLYWLFFSAAIEYRKKSLLHTVDHYTDHLNKLGVECYIPTIVIWCVRNDLIKASIHALIIRLSSNYWINQFQRAT